MCVLTTLMACGWGQVRRTPLSFSHVLNTFLEHLNNRHGVSWASCTSLPPPQLWKGEWGAGESGTCVPTFPITCGQGPFGRTIWTGSPGFRTWYMVAAFEKHFSWNLNKGESHVIHHSFYPCFKKTLRGRCAGEIFLIGTVWDGRSGAAVSRCSRAVLHFMGSPTETFQPLILSLWCCLRLLRLDCTSSR